MTRATFNRLAEQELQEAVEVYKHARHGLGEELLTEVEHAVDFRDARRPQGFPQLMERTAGTGAQSCARGAWFPDRCRFGDSGAHPGDRRISRRKSWRISCLHGARPSSSGAGTGGAVGADGAKG